MVDATLADIRSRIGDVPEAPLRPREQQFVIKYTDPDGREHEGALTSRIMTNDEKIEVARIAASLAGGPWRNLPPAATARITALSTITVQLRDPPGWASKWLPLDDLFLYVVFEQLQAHENEFFRSGGGPGTEGEAAPRISVVPVHASADPGK